MSSINSLLNHDPGRERRPSRASLSHDPYGDAAATAYVPATTYDAASALTALKSFAPIPSRELPSPTFTPAPRRTSSFGSTVAPVEPSPPIDQPPVHSPTLDQYHHSSKTPEGQRRQSLLAAMSPTTILAPIQSLTGALHEHTREEERQTPVAYGTDISQTVPHGESGRDSTQNREPAFVRDEPTTSQIREAASLETSRPASRTPPPTEIPPPLPTIKQEPSPAIKEEPAAASPHVESSPPVAPPTEPHTAQQEDVDLETLKAIEAVKQNDLGLRTKRVASVTESLASPTEAKPASKKRSAPASSGVKKKGTAALKKSSSKKRKIEGDAEVKARSATPTARTVKAASKNARKGSQAGTPVAGSSPPPENSSQVHASEDEVDSSDDNTLYCICRKPDNHRWMIACDGGCEDWFHGSCVNMVQADEELVDKFICPNCQAAGRGQTTWKPMCRNPSCRRPARLTKGAESKYCSDECGVDFMQKQLQRTAGAKGLSPKKSKKKSSKDEESQERASDDDEPIPLGGVIRASDLKALTMAAKDFEGFKRLGSGVLSPPRTASPTKPSFDGLTNGISKDDLLFTPSEREHLRALHVEQEQLKAKLEVLKDREKFVSMARERASRYAEKEKIKVKEFCGYDSRLSWSDPEFLNWRKSKFGRAAFEHSTLSPTPEQIDSLDEDGDVQMNGDNDTTTQQKETMCTKKRCQKHPQWQKLNLQDARFEELEVVEAIKEYEKSERAVRERAQRRAQKDDMEAELMGGGKAVSQTNGVAVVS